jgi:hypothetical protein
MSDEVHEGQHVGCAPCFKIKVGSIQFQGMGAGERRHTESVRTKDMEEYKKLRRQGYQPKNVFGSSEISAKATTKFELEHSVVMAPSIRKEMEARITDAKAVQSA